MEPQDVSAGGTKYGGFWVRVVAAIIDGVIVGVPTSILATMVGFGGDPLNNGLSLITTWLYYALMESSSRQATLGKSIFKLKVTDYNGLRISFARATGRHFAKIISTVILFIGYLMVGWTEKKQGLHDMIAKTLVVRS